VLYVGLDVHKEFCQASVLDDNGEEISNERVVTSIEELDRFLDRFREARFVLESTGVWEFVYGIVEARGFDVVLAHPLKVKAISSAKIKTDKVDARTLARLLYLDMVPSVRQSSSTCYYGHISKQGSRHLRWMMVEAVHVHLWCCPESKLSMFYRKLARKKGKQVARIATARKMLHMIYWMLLNKEGFKVTG